MTAKYSLLLPLLTILLQPVGLFAAQTDSLVFHQGRTRIWCETARFIYEDNGADSLLASINCQSIETLKASISSTDGSLGALRLLNSVDKPAIYAGFSSTEARLQKLVGEIVARLKTSPVRRSSPRRLNSVDSLQQQLMLVALQLGNHDDEEVTASTAGSREAEEEGAILPTADTAAEESSATWPWNEILQWLALLLLGGFAIWRLLDLQSKYNYLKSEKRILEKQVNEFFYSNLQSGQQYAGGQDALSETRIRQLIREELRQNQLVEMPQPLGDRKAAPLPPPPPAVPENKVARQSASASSSPRASSEAAGESLSEDLSDASAPTPKEDNPISKAVSGSVAAPADGSFKSSELFFDKMPFKGGFHQNEMSRERQRDSLYTIQVLQQQTGEADYWITEDVEVQRYAMQNGLSFFEEGCEFAEVEENPVRVVNERKGKLRKEGPVWKIVQKAKVRFE